MWAQTLLAAPVNKYIPLFGPENAPAQQPLLVAAIASRQRGFRFTWQLNAQLGLELERVNDLFFRHRKGEDIYIQCFEFPDPETGNTFRLLGNKTSNNFLIPEHKNSDFFLLLKGEVENNTWDELLAAIKKLTFALAVYNVPFNTIKNKDLLYF